MEVTSYAPLVVSFHDTGEPGECGFCRRAFTGDGTPLGEGHADDCPYTTGVWPVPAPQKCACEECENLVGVVCPRCGETLEEGDSYRLVDQRTGMLAVAPAEGLGICLACAAVQVDAVRDILDAASGD